jgi:hypothetical protein
MVMSLSRTFIRAGDAPFLIGAMIIVAIQQIK